MPTNRKSPELATPGTEEILQNSNGPAHNEIAVLPQPVPKSLRAAFDDAKRALAECRNIEDAKLLRNKAMALVVFAQQAKDRTLIEDATAIRLRAERCAGALSRRWRSARRARDQRRRPQIKVVRYDFDQSRRSSPTWESPRRSRRTGNS